MYLFLFLVGLMGFSALTALGFLSHGDGGQHGHGHGHGHTLGNGHSLGDGHAHAAAHHTAIPHHTPGGVGASHSAPAHAPHGAGPGPIDAHPSTPVPGPNVVRTAGKGGHMVGANRSSRSPMRWLAISPIDIFSYALGAGATGLLLTGKVPASLLPWLAAAMALAFNFVVVKPMMGLILNFASKPSEGLEGAIAQSGVAVTRFDQEGRGLICLDLDGQSVQVLATLDRDEHARGTLVARGDVVTVLEVDPNRNTCRVTRELTA